MTKEKIMKRILMEFISILFLMALIMSSCNNINTLVSSSEINLSSLNSISPSSEQSKSNISSNISGKEDLWSDKKLTVGFITPGASSSYLTQLVKDMQRSFEEWNIQMEFRDSGGVSELQIEYMEELIEMDVDAIGLITNVEIGWENTMKKAKEAGIPIILINRTVNCADESLWTTYIVNDWYGEGEMAGKWIIENIKAGKNVDEEIKVLEVTGEYYSQYSNNYNESIKINQIKEGFRKGIEKNEKVRIVDTLPGGLSSEQSLDVVKEYLRKDKEVDIIFCQSDDMALGAINAIKAVDMIPGEDIIIVSIEGTNAALKAIVEGKIACSVECNPMMGDLFMEACVRLANGETIEREIHPVDRVFDITNAQVELDARKANGYGY